MFDYFCSAVYALATQAGGDALPRTGRLRNKNKSEI